MSDPKLRKWVPKGKARAKRGPRVADEPIEQAFVDVTQCPIITPQFVVRELCPVGLVVMQGPPKEAYKSTLTIIVAALTARWQCQALPPWCESVLWGPTMIWPMEAQPGEINWVLRNALQVEVEDSTIWAALNPWEYKLDADDRCELMLEWLRAKRPRLVILDPFRNMWAGDENDSGMVIQSLQPMQAWAKDNQACVLIVHHVGKPSEGKAPGSMYSGRGSTALPGLADGILTIENGGSQGRIIINAVFKRGSSYRRTVDLGVPGYGWRRDGREVLTKNAHGLITRVRNGATLEEAVQEMQLSILDSQEAQQQLSRNRLWNPGGAQ